MHEYKYCISVKKLFVRFTEYEYDRLCLSTISVVSSSHIQFSYIFAFIFAVTHFIRLLEQYGENVEYNNIKKVRV